jgi:hypothetical protein
MGRLVIIVLLLAVCGFAGARMGARKGINPWLCAAAAFAFGPLFLVFLLFVPGRRDPSPDFVTTTWHRLDDPEVLPPREVRHVAPPPPRDAD